MKTIYLAGGCFWGIQRFLDSAPGIIRTEVGYANGASENPSYEDVRYKQTGHAETCKVIYDETVLSTQKLVKRFLEVIDPFSINKQGEDVGVQYRTGIYYLDEKDLPTIEGEVEAVEKASGKKCAVEVKPLNNFYKAEEYHQKYLDKNPGGYCHILAKF